MGFFPERNGNARKIISRVSEKRSIGFNAFYTFLLVHDYLFDDPTSLEYNMHGFPGIFCYIRRIRGKSYLVSLKHLHAFSKLITAKILHQDQPESTRPHQLTPGMTKKYVSKNLRKTKISCLSQLLA